jgi:endoglucanase
MVDEKLLARVSNARGISGFEDEIQAVVQDVLSGCCDEVRQDRMGNVIGIKKATRVQEGAVRPLRVAFAAHSDEVGMMVKHISPEGYIRFQPVGGLHGPTITAQRVLIYGKELVQGVVVPTHHGSADSMPPLTEMYIDLGRPAEEVRQLVQIGDPITFMGDLDRLNDKVFTGRNFDDRIGTYCLLEAMRGLGDTFVDAYAVSTVQEEVGVRGMIPAAYAIEPDIGIAVDGSCTRGPYRNADWDPTCDMGKGVGVYIMDNRSIGDPRLVKVLLDLAESHDITAQRDIGGGTDASEMQRTKSGALATTIGAPVLYMHSTVQLCHQDDIDATVSLIRTFLEHAHELMVIDE